jgi:hypothetical protein
MRFGILPVNTVKLYRPEEFFSLKVRVNLGGSSIVLTWLDGERITDRSLLNTMEQAIRQVSTLLATCVPDPLGSVGFFGIQVSIAVCRPPPPFPLREGRQVEIS